MAKISAYAAGGAPQNTDLFIVARGTTNVKILWSSIVSAFNLLFAPIANGVTNGDSHDHIGGDGAAITEDAITLADVTTNNASTSKHGFLVKATAPAAGLINYVGIGNGETVYSNKALFDTTNPAAIGTASPGTQVIAARRDHVHAAAESAITFTDITTNDASTTKHGYLLKATAPAAGLINYVGIGNGETVYSNKALFDTTNPEAIGTAAPGTQVIAARRDHVHAQAAFINLGAGSTLTISGGIVTATSSYHLIDTEGGAGTDDLDTINGGSNGDILVLRSLANTRDPTIKDGTGNLFLAGDFVMNLAADSITLIKAGTSWFELSRSDNA